MNSIYLTEEESSAVVGIINGDASDPVALIRSVGYEPFDFFEYGNWNGVDFRRSDLNGVSFIGAELKEAVFTPEQIAVVAATNPRVEKEGIVLKKAAPGPNNRQSKDRALIQFHLIGQFRIFSKKGEDLTPKSTKAKAILVLLSTAPEHRRSRAWLADVLWSDSGEEQARASLRQAVAQIRRIFDGYAEVINITRNELALNSQLIGVDVVVPNLRDLATPIKESDILDGLEINDRAFQEWLLKFRSDTVRTINKLGAVEVG